MASNKQVAALRQLQSVVPDIFNKEGNIDFELLAQKYGVAPSYSMHWFGKREAKENASKGSLGSLRPKPHDSVNWDTTQNVFIEGDNLEVLKLLKKAYFQKVKCIYIDPPYNTGNDFVYKDNYKNGVAAYLEATGQVSSVNAEKDGRFHTNWLNMIYPRLLLAYNLLREDGAIFISIDDSEFVNLRKVVDEVFGETNFVGNFIWKKKFGGGQDSEFVVTEHEYVMCYAKNIKNLKWHDESVDKSSIEGGFNKIEKETGRKYKTQQLRKWGADELREDQPTLHYPITDPEGNVNFPLKDDKINNKIVQGRWRHGKNTMKTMIEENRIEWSKKVYSDGVERWMPYEKLYLDEQDDKKIKDRSIILDVGGTEQGTEDLIKLFKTARVFDFPKPVALIKKLIGHLSCENDDIILDFFAGSGTTAQAVMELNATDMIQRRFVCVQLPEKVEDTKQQSVMFKFLTELKKKKTISEATKERIRRAAKKIQEENPEYKGDLGFRVFSLDKSNFKKSFEPNLEGIDERTREQRWQDNMNCIKAESSMLEVFFEITLSDGLPLDLKYDPIEFGGINFLQTSDNKVLLTIEPITFKQAEKVGFEICRDFLRRKRRKDDSCPYPNVYFYGAAMRSDYRTFTQLWHILKQFEINNINNI